MMEIINGEKVWYCPLDLPMNECDGCDWRSKECGDVCLLDQDCVEIFTIELTD